MPLNPGKRYNHEASINNHDSELRISTAWCFVDVESRLSIRKNQETHDYDVCMLKVKL